MPRDVFSPTFPQKLAGMRVEPPPSSVCAIGTTPAATSAAEPPLEPPGVWPRLHGLRVTPVSVDSVISVKPNSGFHFVESDPDGTVSGIRSVEESDYRVNGGFFVLRQEIFDSIRSGEELVQEPFQRLIQKRKLHTYRYDGFWQCMDTFKDKQRLDELMEHDAAPWQISKPSKS